MQKNIAVIHGDGIGPEIVNAALAVLRAVESRFGHTFIYDEVNLGGVAIDREGEPLPERTLKTCQGADGVLLGAVGGPKWESLPGDKRPEKGLLGLRKGMGLYANLRPARLVPALAAACPLKQEVAGDFDFLVVRELIGGVYFGQHTTREENGEKIATDIMEYAEGEVERIVQAAFKYADIRAKCRMAAGETGRKPKVTSVDKANVLDTSRLWRAVAEGIAKTHPGVEFENMLVDNAAMQIVKNPAQFDVMVTENLFGDILSDEASMITGSIGMIPSASLGEEGKPGLFEPIHGSAPDIAGQDKANPVGTILSAAMLLRYSLGMENEAAAVEAAVDRALAAGLRTADVMEEGEGRVLVGCKAMGDTVARFVAEG